MPTDLAWSLASVSPLQVRHTLERHLVLGDRIILSQGGETQTVAVLRGAPLLVTTKQGEDGELIYLVTSDGLTAKVLEADIECSDGVIHLIDTVILKVGREQGCYLYLYVNLYISYTKYIIHIQGVPKKGE